MSRHALLAGAGFALVCGSAHALTETFYVTATGFYPANPSTPGPAPVDPAVVDFTVTANPTVDTYPTSAGLNVFYTNLPAADFPAQFSYDAATMVIMLATDPLGLNACDLSANSFCFFISQTCTSPYVAAGDFMYDTSSGDIWVNTGSTTTPAVPEPAAWTLMLVGIGALGWTSRTRQRRLRANAAA